MLKKQTRQDLINKWQQGLPEPVSVRDAKPEEKENTLVDQKLAKSLTDDEIEFLFPKRCLNAEPVNWHRTEKRKEAYTRVKAVCEKMRFHALESYTIIKDRKAYTYERTEGYPVYMVDEGAEFRLLYQPMHADQTQIYQYYGYRPDFFLHGFDRLQKEIARQKKQAETIDEDYDKLSEEQQAERREIRKFGEVVIVADLAEAFGPALLGYATVYHGGKKHELAPWDYVEITKVCEKVYQVRNNDPAQKEICHKAALTNLDLFTFETPKNYLEERPDSFNIPRLIVTLRDFFKWHGKHEFKEILEDSMPYRFWDLEEEYEGRGDKRMFVGYRYKFSPTKAFNFLNKMGFYRLPSDGEKNDFVFVRVDGNIIRKHKANDVKNFINEFLKERRLDHSLRDVIHRTGLNESLLSSLEDIDIDFTDFDRDTQFIFFENGTYEVTADEKIKFHPAGKIKRYVWDTDVIEHNIAPARSPFKAIKQPDGTYDIEVLHNDCLFFNYLIQTSRMHWRTELEVKLADLSKDEQDKYKAENKFNIAGDKLLVEERMEQKQHLLNKIYSLGYLLHRYKNRSQSWAVVGVDNNTPADGRSHGGSGKSICFNQAVGKVLKNVFKIPGTNPAITQNQHIFYGLTEHHRLTVIDDADKNLSFRFFYEYITGDQVVNPKNAQQYTLDFDHLCKLVWLTNFSFNTDSSSRRRILYAAFSDLYHAKSENNDYAGSHEPKDDFGKELFKDFTVEEYNQFYNTMAYCLQFYLQCPYKLEPPMKNVERRNLQREMGELMEEWANTYFSKLGGNIDKLIVKEEAWQEFQKQLPKNASGYNSRKFKEAITAFCKYHGYIFNPVELHNDGKRIMHWVRERQLNKSGWWDPTGRKKAQEMIYIQTDIEIPLNRTLPGDEISDLPTIGHDPSQTTKQE